MMSARLLLVLSVLLGTYTSTQAFANESRPDESNNNQIQTDNLAHPAEKLAMRLHSSLSVSDSGTNADIYKVPSGIVLVLDTVSLSGGLALNINLSHSALLLPDTAINKTRPKVLSSDNNKVSAFQQQQIKNYITDNNTISCIAFINNEGEKELAGSNSITCTLFGRLIPAITSTNAD